MTTGPLEPQCRFTAIDPSRPMLDLTVARLTEQGLLDRTDVVLGTVEHLPAIERFDGATMIGVLAPPARR